MSNWQLHNPSYFSFYFHLYLQLWLYLYRLVYLGEVPLHENKFIWYSNDSFITHRHQDNLGWGGGFNPERERKMATKVFLAEAFPVFSCVCLRFLLSRICSFCFLVFVFALLFIFAFCSPQLYPSGVSGLAAASKTTDPTLVTCNIQCSRYIVHYAMCILYFAFCILHFAKVICVALPGSC